MTVSITHKFVSTDADSSDTSLVQPSNWNDTHVVTGLAPSATTDTTNASNITTGTLPSAQLPLPTNTTVGGVKAVSITPHNWVAAIGVDGGPVLSRPDATDISSLGTFATQNYATPPIIGGTTPNAATFTTLNATGLTWSGSLLSVSSATSFTPQIKLSNTTVDSSAPYWNSLKYRGTSGPLANDSLGTFNFGGLDSNGTALRNAAQIAAYAVSVGTTYVEGKLSFFITNSAGTTANRLLIAGALTTSFSPLSVTDTTDSTSTTTGSLITSGGLGVAKSLNVGSGIKQTSSGQFYQNLGAKIDRLNDRVLVGPATVNDANNPSTTKDWLETLIPNTTSISQVASLATNGGGFGLLGGLRSSDQTAAFPGSLFAVGSFGVNDNVSLSKIVTGNYVECRHSSGLLAGSYTLGSEIDVVALTGATEGSIYPYSMTANLQTANLWLSNGRPDVTSGNVTAAIGIINNTGSPFTTGLWSAGIVMDANALDTTSGHGHAIELAKNYAVEWYVSGTTTPMAYITSSIASGTSPVSTLTFGDAATTFAGSPVAVPSLTATTTVTTGAVAVASLPSAASSAHARMFVTDSTVVAAGNFGAIVAGTGTNVVPVYCDGTNWRIG